MSKEKNILFVVHALKAGGVETVLNALADEFVDLGHNVMIVSLSKDDSEQARAENIKSKNIKLYQCRIDPSNKLQFLLSPIFLIPFFIKHRKFDLIIIPGIVNAIAVIPLIKAMLIKAKIVVNAHTAFSAYYKNAGQFKRCILKLGGWILPLADVVGNDSIGAAEDLSKHYKLKSVKAIYNPAAKKLDLAFEQKREHAPHPWLQSNDFRVFVSCGRFVESKNYAHMIRVFARLVATDFKNRLILVGTGPEEKALKRLTSDLRLSEFISFEGYVDDPKLYFYHANYFWLSSKFEGFSMVLGEALAMGTPCRLAKNFSELPDKIKPILPKKAK
jgi:glycosyltransferase involved in cell wall biosynthesis